MTSTNIFSGHHADKNSSKVLKPPGGGHTDIFGAPEPPVKKDSGRNASSIMEGTNNVPEKPKTPVKAAPPSASDPPPTENSAPRNRVPPGGYSSGPLW